MGFDTVNSSFLEGCLIYEFGRERDPGEFLGEQAPELIFLP